MKRFWIVLLCGLLTSGLASAQTILGGAAGGGGGGSFPPSGCSTANGVIFNNATPCSSAFTFTPSTAVINLNGVPFLYQVTTNDVYGGGAGNTGSTGVESTGFGYLALNSVDTGGANSGFGTSALQMVTSGAENVGIGTHAGKVITTGNNNTSVGSDSMFSLTTGSANTCMGFHCMFGPNDGMAHNTLNNTCVGSGCLLNISSGSGNSLLGDSAGAAMTTASDNDGIGHGLLASEQTGTGNTGFGYDALISQNGASYNTAIGFQTGFGITSGQNNVLIGAAPDAASYNQVTSGSNNVAIGYDVAVPTATASDQLVISNFIYGTGMAGTGGTISSGSVGFGTKAPSFTVHIVGTLGATSTVTFSGLTTGTNADFLCLSATGVVLVQTSACTISTLRYKPDWSIYDGTAMDVVRQLEVGTFHFDDWLAQQADPNARSLQIGLNAENIARVLPLAAVYENDMVTPKSYRQEGVIALYGKALQETDIRIGRLEADNDNLRAEVEALRRSIGR